jgi:hypothetical protein
MKELADAPLQAGLWEGIPDVELRVWPIRRFRSFLIYYRPIRNGIEVVRVLHAAQDAERIFRG